MQIDQLIQELAEADVFLVVQDGRLLCKANEGALTTERRALITKHKAQLIEFLNHDIVNTNSDEPELKARYNKHTQLSPAQQRLWFIEQLTEFGANYTIPVAYRLSGALQTSTLRDALQRIIERHESLRTVIVLNDGKPAAQVQEQVNIDLEPEKLETLSPEDREDKVRAVLQEAVTAPFDLTREIPIRARLFRLQPEEHVLMLTLHHTAADGWSVENLLHELSLLYSSFIAGGTDPLPDLDLQYSDYAAWQREWLQGARLERQLDYWRNQLAGSPPVHSLPLDRPRPADSATAGATWRRPMAPALHPALGETAQRQGVTLFMLLQAAFAVFLGRWTQETDIVMGTPVANRPREELSPLIGFFANTLAFRTRLDGNPRFSEVLEQTREMTLGAFDHQHLPFEMLVEDLNPPRSLSLAPLVQIMFSLQDIDEDTSINLPGIISTPLVPDSSNAKFDLSLSINKTSGGLEYCWDYCSDLFDADTIARMAVAFEVLLHDIAKNPAQHIQSLSLSTDQERAEAILPEPESIYPRESSIAELVSEQAARQPKATAIAHAEESLNYNELERRANHFAHTLQAEGVQPGDRIGVCLNRGLDLVVMLLAVLKTGAAYVPLDPESPEARLSHMVSDTGMKLLVTDGSASGPERLDSLKSISIKTTEVPDNAPEKPLPKLSGGDHLAYVMYTSGSTGIPKGVAVPHRGVVRLVKNTNYIHLDASTVMAQVSNVAFDAATFEIWGALCNGGRLVVLDKEQLLSPTSFCHAVESHGLTTAFVTTALFNRFAHERPESFSKLKYLLFGGEQVSPDAVHRVLEAGKPEHLLHVYGPTENTTFSTWCELDGKYAHSALIPIGRPIAHSQAYVVNEVLELQPIGAVGELMLAGDGLAHGYWERPELTAERFMDCPADWGGTWPLYRSGDLVRRLPSGELEYIGRLDSQVKIRGFRIEPGEIEECLRSHPAVKDAVVIVREERGQDARQLVAYWVIKEAAEKNPDSKALQQHLAQHLPSYMVPSAYVAMSSLPMTINGKLDRRALPEPDTTAYSTVAYVAPETELEKELVSMWQDLLKIDGIGIDTNFFDLGGHSLLLTQLHNRISAQFGVELALKQLFTAETIREQAELIASVQSRPAPLPLPALRPQPSDAQSVMSFAQQRLWFIDQMGNAEAAYNIPCVLRLSGEIHSEAIHRALTKIVERHEVLRTPLIEVGGKARPRLLKRFELELRIDDLSNLDEAERAEAVRDRMNTEASRPFNLDSDLFLRAGLLRLAERDHVLMLTLHHIAADGWSINVLLDELAELYNSEITGRDPGLPELTVQYADYAHWQRQWLRGERLESQQAYWEQQLADLPALHSLPLDFPRPDTQQYRGAVHWQSLPEHLLEQLQSLARRHDATLFIALQAAFSVVLARWSGHTDIVMGTPIANRRHDELSPLIGFFANTLVLRNDLSGNPSFSDVMERTRTVALNAYQHQDLPFEMLVDQLSPQRSLGYSPLFQVMLVLEYDGDEMPEFNGLSIKDIAGESHHAKFDITLNIRQTANGLEAIWGYCRDLFHADTIARMADSFRILLEAAVTEPERRIAELPLISEDRQTLPAAMGPNRPLPEVAGVHILFEHRVAAAPDAVAIRHAGDELSYAELNKRANRVAHALLAQGIKPDTPVGIHVRRGIDMLVGMLGILKAGGAYVPLDPAHPTERLKTLLKDSGAVALLNQHGLAGKLDAGNLPCLMLDDEATLHEYAESNPEVARLKQEHLAYIIYTSGSTGTPKGVMVEHGNLLNLVDDCCRRFADDHAVEASQWTSFGFDASAFEIFVSLALGGTLNIVPDAILADTERLLTWLDQHKVTHAYLPPFFVRALDNVADERIAALSLRRLLVGVEPLSETGLHRLQRLLPDMVMVNGYGTSETTVFSTCYTEMHDVERSAPIGRPITNTRVLILDENLQPVPPGVIGEIHIAGRGVARGYLNRPELTQEKFIRDASGDRLYRTGDLARWLPDEQLEFHGRKDKQIKLNGVRIEPAEIEHLLGNHPQIEWSAVALRHDTPNSPPQLVAYFVPKSDSTVTAHELHEHLAQHLPTYMLPAMFVALAELPLDVNGRLDERALPALDTDISSETAYEAPETPLERQLSDIWCEVLGYEQIDVNAYFFDLGGNSLCAVRLMAAIREATGRSMPISVLFKAPSIRALAAEMEEIESLDQAAYVTLRNGEDAQPLFVFHAAGGDVLCYQPMLKYLPDSVPVYGFARSESTNMAVPALKSIEQLAEGYLVHVLKLQPEGALRLAGWSSGGLLALEIAHRLEKLGREVELVYLVDTMLPTGDDVPEKYRRMGLPALQDMTPAEACQMMREYDSDLIETTPHDGILKISESDYFNYLVAANQIGLDFYRPDFSVSAAVHYYACSQNYQVKTVVERINELQSLVAKPINSQEFDASHFSIMEEPDVSGLGLAIASTMAGGDESRDDKESGMRLAGNQM